MQNNRGGKRKGAERKPAPEGTVKVPYATKLEPLLTRLVIHLAAQVEGVWDGVVGSDSPPATSPPG